MSLSGELRRSAADVWDKIFGHPFVVELYTGTLPLEKFKFYVAQDYNFLVAMYRCFSLMAAKADYELARKALEVAHLEATTEMANYEKLLGELGLSLEEVLRAEPAPTNVAYTSFLNSVCALGTAEECLVAVLPCFWTYAEIAERHKDKLSGNRERLYVDWARVYLSEEYLRLVDELKALLDKRAGAVDPERAKVLFRTASRYEYMFWDMAYKMEEWPV